jgi:hypothetical protein
MCDTRLRWLYLRAKGRRLGDLHRRSTRIYYILDQQHTLDQPVPVWSLNIDKPKGPMNKGLRLLWDATDNL